MKLILYYQKGKNFFTVLTFFLSFEDDVVEEIITPMKNKMKSKNENVQFIFCVATFNNSIQKFIEEGFENVSQITTTNLHKTIKNVKHKFIEMNGKDKLQEVEKILKENDHVNNKTKIFFF